MKDLASAALLLLAAPHALGTEYHYGPPTPPELRNTTDHEGCKNVIVGAGWSGTYFAWRTAVNTRKFDPKETCIFEATNRVGGRAYSRRGIPGMDQERVDLGAYRFDTHNHVLINEVIVNTLHLKTKCYDPNPGDPANGVPPMCNSYGNLTNVEDQYGSNAGYSSGPEGLANLFIAEGGRLLLHHQLTGVYEVPGKTNEVELAFDIVGGSLAKTKFSITAEQVFLNIPVAAVNDLAPQSLLRDKTKTSEVTQFALKPSEDEAGYLEEQVGAKQFLVYGNAVWRSNPNLQYGDFTTVDPDDCDHGCGSGVTTTPPLVGRFHDFSGRESGCKAGESPCFGAIMTYYDFNPPCVEYWRGWHKKIKQHNGEWEDEQERKDPYSFVSYEKGTEEMKALIENTHKEFMKQIKAKDPTYDTSKVPFPTGTVIAVWTSKISPQRPAPSFPRDDFSTVALIPDTTRKMLNRISKPLDNYPIYIGNEAYSGGVGWGQPALMMTERVLWRYFSDNVLPPMVVESGTGCNLGANTFGAAPNVTGKCQDLVSRTWYAEFIQSDNSPDSDPLPTKMSDVFPNCLKGKKIEGAKEHCGETEALNEHYIALATYDEDDNTACKVASTLPEETCTTSVGPQAGTQIHVSWEWPDSQTVKVVVEAEVQGKGKPRPGWVGLGFGAGMTGGEMYIASTSSLDPASYVLAQYYAPEHFWPLPLIGDDNFLKSTGCENEAGIDDGKLSYCFTRPVDPSRLNKTRPGNPYQGTPRAGVKWPTINLDGPTDVFVAFFDQPTLGLVQHSWMQPFQIDFRSCGRSNVEPLGWEEDIKGLFRTKDRDAMLFQFDLHDYETVKSLADEIIKYTIAKRNDNIKGMPRDKPWSLEYIHKFQRWVLQGKPEKQEEAGYPYWVDGQSGPAPSPGPVDCTKISWDSPIKGYFRPVDVTSMMHRWDLSKYQDVKDNAPMIFDAVANGRMPCAQEGGAWPKEKVETFKKWMDCDFPESASSVTPEDRHRKNLAARSDESVLQYTAEARKNLAGAVKNLVQAKASAGLAPGKAQIDKINRAVDSLVDEL